MLDILIVLFIIWFDCGLLSSLLCVVIDLFRGIGLKEHNWGLLAEQICLGPISLVTVIFVLFTWKK